MVVFVVFILMFVVVAVFGYAFLKSYTPLADRPTPMLKSTQVSGGACGNCGYPARGITTFECPECGADLREAGIVRPGQGGGRAGLIIVTALAYCIGFLIVSSILYGLINSQLPRHYASTADARLTPASGQYSAEIEVAGEEMIWNTSNWSQGLDFYNSGNVHPLTASSNLTLTLNGLTKNTTLTEIRMPIVPTNPPSSTWSEPSFQIDPVDRTARWTDLNGKTHTGGTPATEQDMLRFFSDAGLDTTQQATSDEAKELFALLDGIAQGQSSFNLTGFSNYGRGSTGSGSGGPPWFGPIYFVISFVLWILGLVWIARRMSGNAKTRTKT